MDNFLCVKLFLTLHNSPWGATPSSSHPVARRPPHPPRPSPSPRPCTLLLCHPPAPEVLTRPLYFFAHIWQVHSLLCIFIYLSPFPGSLLFAHCLGCTINALFSSSSPPISKGVVFQGQTLSSETLFPGTEIIESA